ncbi:glutaredoxin 3 [Parvularcula dongshanensis]|uniref:Glutaredoxin n=1 Tax=Parvularcula dongshanensis TaxID=1173995 RepID=A0A840I3K9_9PROT|nr:glutaredoxin 3 [Parvularcula dongshanensis]MBB4658794.1 glutaredoxin 3 [Parvularcula dongshanensis]
MKPVTLYTKAFCPYCARAEKLLKQKGVDFTDIPAAFDREKKAEMVQRSGGRATFPQIFIGDTHVGGYDDLYALDQAGKLDPMLAD